MESEIKEYNKRQINLIEEKIQDYLDDKIYIGWLIEDIEALICCLKETPRAWLKKLDDIVWEIEILYACALDENRNSFTAEESKKVYDLLIKMKNITKKYKIKYLACFDEQDFDF
jgi:hypothetical protein